MTRSNHSGRFIPSEEIDAQTVRRWHFSDVDRPQSLGGAADIPVLPMLNDLLPPPAPPAAPVAEASVLPDVGDDEHHLREEEVQAQLAQARQEAHDAAYQQGLEQGRADGLRQGQQQTALEWQQRMDAYQAQQGQQIAAQLQGVLQGAQRDVKDMQQRMAPDLLQLACDIARQVVRQELRTNPQALLPVVREALDMMSAESKPVTVRMHPQDWEHLQQPLKDAFPQPKIEWLADASVIPGDCRIESAGAQIDGGVERRWQRAVGALGLVSTWYEGAPAHAQ